MWGLVSSAPIGPSIIGARFVNWGTILVCWGPSWLLLGSLTSGPAGLLVICFIPGVNIFHDSLLGDMYGTTICWGFYGALCLSASWVLLLGAIDRNACHLADSCAFEFGLLLSSMGTHVF